ncbi:MAG: hypothetical protein AAF092_03010 [Pseudomonadota bacterium]
MSKKLTAVGLTVALWAAGAGALLVSEALFLTKHAGDALHMIAIVERMAQGQVPHLDFMTPIGAFAFWPIAALVDAGLGAGRAFLVAQVAIGALCAAAALAIALPRMAPVWASALAALVLALAMALVPGEAEIAITISMHYNRWAWGFAFVVITAAVLRPDRARLVDGVIIGALMAALAMTKVTYFVALMPLVLLGLAMTAQWRALGVAAVTGALIAGALTLTLGVGYWAAYAGDLLAVAASDIRPQPGLRFGAVLTSPAYLLGTVLAFAMAVLIRRRGLAVEGLLTFPLLGAGAYITYQNFGNEHFWLALFALLLVVWAPRAGGAGRAMTLAAAAAAAMVLPSFLNMAGSPFRHLAIPAQDYRPLLIGADRHQDIAVSRLKANRLRSDTPLAGAQLFDDVDLPTQPIFRGAPLPDCRTEPVAGYFASITSDLEAQGLAQGQGVFVVDILNPYWLYGDHRPLAGGTPWYYGGLPGYEDAEFVLLPSCPILTTVRNGIAELLADEPLEEVAVRPLYTLYSKGL